MASDDALFRRINDAVLDLLRADYQSLNRPYRVLVQSLDAEELRPITEALTRSVDLDVFLAASESSIGSIAGSGHLAWPEEHEKYLGLCLLLLRKYRDDPNQLFNFTFTYFHATSSTQTLRKFVSNLVIPFVRDFTAHARAHLAVPEPGQDLRSGSTLASSIQIQNFQGVLGNVNGSTLHQNLQMTFGANNLDGLIAHLGKQGVNEVELAELRTSIEADPTPNAPGTFGPHVSAWIGKMVGMAAAGVWGVSLGAAGNLLAAAIDNYYGQSPR